MYTVDAHGQELGILDLESQLEWIKKDSEQLKRMPLSFISSKTWFQMNEWSINISFICS